MDQRRDIYTEEIRPFAGKFDLIKDYGFLSSHKHASSKRGFPTFRKLRDNCRFDMTLNKKTCFNEITT